VLESAASAEQRFDFVPLLAPVRSVIESADLAICHMELPLGRPGERPGAYGRSPFGGNLLQAPYELAGSVAAVGFDRCSTASNHALDLGLDGIDTTLDVLDEAGLGHVGTARSVDEAAPQVFDVAGVKVAHLSYTDYSNTPIVGEWWQMRFVTTPDPIAADVLTARAMGAEVVIVSLHIAKEMLTAPTAYDREFVEQLTATVPVDLIVQHGPHVLQPVEVVNGAVVYWSIGNLLSGMGVPGTGKYTDTRTLDGLLATVRFTEVEPGRFIADSRPVLVCNERSTRVVYAPFTTLLDPTIDPDLRSQLEQCIERSLAVQPLLF
jgi:poly-gamma-glutamate capsule biosynthesis protein CapA/YwtB (metallophosphatase superfamily)